MAQRPGHHENWSRNIRRALKCGAGGEWRIKWSEKVTNEEVLEHIGEKKMFVDNILCTKANCVGHILSRICLLCDAIEEQMTEVKGVGRRRIQLLDDLRNKTRYWELWRKMKIKKGGNDNLSYEHKKELQVIFC